MAQQSWWQIFRRPASAGAWSVAALLACMLISGCSGCQPIDPIQAKKEQEEKEAEERRKKSEKPKPDYEAGEQAIDPGEGKVATNAVKSGHWVTAAQPFKANNGDLPQAELYSAAVDMNNRPLEVDHTPFRLVMSRPVSISKGTAKHLESLYYVPRRYGDQSTGVRLQNKLFARGGTREIYHPNEEPTIKMPFYQYHLVVLANEADRYGYIKRLESVNPVVDSAYDSGLTHYYRVSLPKIDKRVPLPWHSLAWSSIAFVFWDGINPAALTTEQQQGLIDWIHWGGQLVISGPDSLDTLRGSYLDAYLPADKLAAKELDQGAFDEVNAYWSLVDKMGTTRSLDVVAGKLPVGVELKKRPEGEFVPHTGELVLERRVGRGRVVVTAFSLTNRTIVNWGSFDNFFNGAILRRPPRIYSFNPELDGLKLSWVNRDFSDTDPRLISTLRYFSRDVSGVAKGKKIEIDAENAAKGAVAFNSTELTKEFDLEPERDWHFRGYTLDGQSGVAGWNDDSAAADAARKSLRQAAGISIPKADFVLRVLAVYLVVLVPVNWGFFRLLGRVEWAWLAAPVIAVAGAIAVIRMAQLDIGFARSHTELAILEAHADHDRAHATRYVALYSSLSTSYELEFADPSSLGQPFPREDRRERKPPDPFNRPAPTTCYLRREQGLTLSGVVVGSNSTDFVHTEQMLSLGGAFKLNAPSSGWQVENQTDFTLQEAAVLRCVEEGSIEVAYIGTLEAKRSLFLKFEPVDSPNAKEWEASAVMSPKKSAEGTLNLAGVAQLATKNLRLEPGEARLIGWTDEPLPGLDVRPAATQVNTRSLVLVHLREPRLPDVFSDANLRSAFQTEAEKNEGDETPPSENAEAEAPLPM